MAKATALGRTIIEEGVPVPLVKAGLTSLVSLASSSKTIARLAQRGIAGGEKYVADGIFFKLATDAYSLYGGADTSEVLPRSLSLH